MEAHPLLVALLLSFLVFGSTGATDNPAAENQSSTSVVSRNDISASSSESPALRWLRIASAGALRSFSSGAMSIPPVMVTAFAVIGAVVVALLGAGAIAAIILSLFGVRMCYVLGTCHDPYGFIGATPYEMPYPAYAQIPYPASSYPHAKSSDGTGNELPQYDAYSQVSYPTSYQKRSLDYVGPILKALGSAYGQHYGTQHYGQQYYNQQNSQQLPGTPRKASDLQSTSPTETNHNPDK